MRNKELLLHSCCAPCSSHCLEQLSNSFNVTVFFYNPNIDSYKEYEKRMSEQKRLLAVMPSLSPITFLEGTYEPSRFYLFAEELSDCKEGGKRCEKCFELRLRESAKVAKEEGFPYFTTTLTVSPHKNAETINRIGEELSGEFGVSFLPSDFKKKNGYRRSIELSKQYGLYRQNYCGCKYSYRTGK